MPDATADNPSNAEPPKPLVVDLDGTLVATDTLHESLLEIAGRRPGALLQAAGALSGGRARFKAVVGGLAEIDVATLPYRDAVLELIDEARDRGRPVVLASAAHRSVVEAVAEHLGLFDAVIATDAGANQKGQAKLDAIRDLLMNKRWGGRFDYVGDNAADLPIWAEAQTAYLVNVSKGVAARARAQGEVTELVPRSGGGWLAMLRACRPHQWCKNLLLLVPMIAGQALANASLWPALVLAFIAFSLCASSVYLLNDLLDLRADRLHPSKRHRPMAAGTVSIRRAVLLGAVLLATAFTLAALWLPGVFVQVLAVYLVLTTAYSCGIKGKVMVDVIWLACLYTLRIIAGGVAVAIEPSQWLLGFSLFTFLSLAFAKRYCELRVMQDAGRDQATGRGYKTGDLRLVQTMGVTAGYLSVLIFAMYINSDTVTVLYREPRVLWLACPLILYWISRLWVLAERSQLSGDPLLFALTDRVSYVCIAVMAFVLMWANA